MIDYNLQFIRFPTGKVHEAVTKNEDDSYTIFIDKNITFEAQRKRFMHVMKHLSGNDFEKENADEIEFETHEIKA